MITDSYQLLGARETFVISNLNRKGLIFYQNPSNSVLEKVINDLHKIYVLHSTDDILEDD